MNRALGIAMNDKTFVMNTLKQMDERPEDIAQGLRAFQKSARVLSSDHPRLIDEYPDQWVAVLDSKVLAHGDTLEGMLQQMNAKNISYADAIVRFIERSHRTLIL